MSEIYEVKQGDYLVKIAEEKGFADWREIYEHADNAEFRKKRPNPNLLYPGDKIVIPDKKVKEVLCRPEKKYCFKLRVHKTNVHIAMIDVHNDPLPIFKYELRTSGRKSNTYSRTRNDKPAELENGIIHEEISPAEEKGELKIWLDDENSEADFTYTIKMGHLDPIDKISGIKGRLKNLGYDCGEVNDVKDEKTAGAVKNFQKDHGLHADGELNALTRDSLERIYGA